MSSGDDVFIGMNCLVLKGVTIRYGSVVGAGSVVTADVGHASSSRATRPASYERCRCGAMVGGLRPGCGSHEQHTLGIGWSMETLWRGRPCVC